jgi:hypothetical protein
MGWGVDEGVLVVHGPLVLAKSGEGIRGNGRSGRGHVLRQELAAKEIVQALALEPVNECETGYKQGYFYLEIMMIYLYSIFNISII